MHSMRTLAAALAVFASSAEEAPAALNVDDECVARGEEQPGCALSALQRRGLQVSAKVEDEGESTWGGSCAHYGCHHHYHSWMRCQCNDKCAHYGNCCVDYVQKCAAPPVTTEAPVTTVAPVTTSLAPAPPIPSSPSPPVPAAAGPYRLKWSAQGTSFFDSFKFLFNDDNHGSAQYLSQGEAEEAKVVQAFSNHAIMRAGPASPQYKYKRMTAKIASKQAWKYFLATVKFSHVPYGCGVWPALFTLASDAPWPDGGEIDVLEYVNMDVSKASFHTGGSCKLDQAAVNKFGYMPDRNKMDYDCVTKYPKRLGCAPNKWMKSGESWAHSPGVLATQWTESFLKIFHFPEHEIPEDILSDSPEPDNWDRWLFSYYPFEGTSCDMQAQQILMQINFCGDWAGKVWGDDNQCKWKANSCRSVDPLAEYAPEQDCCTQFIWDADKKYGTDDYLNSRAFFNISWMKVYQ